MCVFATDPAGVDMYHKLPDGTVVSKRGSSRNETKHSVNNRIYHGSNVGMRLFHSKVYFSTAATVFHCQAI